MSEILTRGEQLDLFADIGRWPRRPYCSDDLASGLRIRSLASALTKAYIQANPPHLRVWALFDIDRPGAACAWEDAYLPPPTWTSINRTNGHAHSVWGLRVPVLTDGLGARDAPLRYLCSIESLMAERLEADPGFGGLITKNPAHPLWMTLKGPRLAYDLIELAEYLPGLEKHRPKRRAPEQIGLGRNVALFDRVRHWAYRAIRPYWGTGLQGWNAWLSQCNSRALTYNADFLTPLGGREVWHIARSVAKWTWKHTTAEGFSSWQARAGQKAGIASGKVRRQASEDKRVTARLMAAAGRSVREIAAELGVGKSTVDRWVRD
ncbi:replication initiation protein [Azohydromonas caseinilytica]|uniref:Helix-turn-helix domain-containing protein n=1 Tax=Azohydromonas caseinilytica TaxID=2728836 RepID=A0A848FJW0_9BURK|nr:replication initiation protein [Azohydromonas caseinilytica]NML19175.1 helix-turn-helix domain-containing protein [Azohydromonas caseinilytica]